MYELTEEERRITCFHEAAHAVVHAIGGAFVGSVEVAPVGAMEWATQGENGEAISDLWGICRGGDRCDAGLFIRWKDEAGYQVDASGYRAYRRQHGDQRHRSFMYRHLRRYICGVLAGPVSDRICDGWPIDEIWLDPWEDSLNPAHDVIRIEPHPCAPHRRRSPGPDFSSEAPAQAPAQPCPLASFPSAEMRGPQPAPAGAVLYRDFRAAGDLTRLRLQRGPSGADCRATGPRLAIA